MDAEAPQEEKPVGLLSRILERFKLVWCILTHGSWTQSWPVYHSWHHKCLKCGREYDVFDF